MSKIHDTAISLLEAEEALIMSLELNDPLMRPKRVEHLQRFVDALLKHHQAVEDVQLAYPKDSRPTAQRLLKEMRHG